MRGDREPPGRKRPDATPDTGPIQKSADTTTDKTKITAQPRRCRSETWTRRRRQAAQRLTPLDCGCRDPLLACRCEPPPEPLSERMVDAGADAARHILEIGCVPLLQLEVLRALYRRGGDDRQFAQELYTLAGGEA